MLFWIAILSLGAVCALILWRAAARSQGAADEAVDYDIAVYKAQLSEVDKDLARGIVDEADAERVRTEIARRILTADAAREAALEDSSSGRAGAIMIGAGVAMLAGAVGLYMAWGAPGYGDLGLASRIAQAEALREDRPSQAEAEAALPASARIATATPPADYVALVEQLRLVVRERDDDAEGWRLLATGERNLGNYAAAHKAFARHVDILGEDATANEFGELAGFLLDASGGYVSPEAEVALDQALARDPRHGPSLYYMGMLEIQTGRPDRALRIWDALLRQGPPEAPWIGSIEAQIPTLAEAAGVRYSVPVIGGTAGPSAEDIEAAGDMTPSERLEMIEGMVSGLSERLATEGGPPRDWARLITSLGVLGRSGQARAVYDNAVEVFAENPTAMDIIQRAGEQANIAN